ncbi:MAG: hypothetical protein ACE5I7_19890 [Candidatus Binatia bacterium]
MDMAIAKVRWRPLAVAFLIACTLSDRQPAAARLVAYTANYDSSSLSVIDVGERAVVQTLSVCSRPATIAVTADGQRAYVGCLDQVSVVNTSTNMVAAVIPVQGFVSAAAFTPRGDELVIGRILPNPSGQQGVLSVIDVARNSVAVSIPLPGLPSDLAIPRSGAAAYVSSLGYPGISVVDLHTHSIRTTIPVEPGSSMPSHLRLSPSERNLYVTTATTALNDVFGAVVVIDVEQEKTLGRIEGRGGPTAVAVSPDGATLYVTELVYPVVHPPLHGTSCGHVSVVELATSAQLMAIPTGCYPAAIALTPDGQQAYVANRAGNSVTVIDAASNRVINTIPVGAGPLDIAIATAGATPTPCSGDCNGDGAVQIDELVTLVNIALGAVPAAQCSAADGNQDGRITVAEILSAVDAALNGCDAG